VVNILYYELKMPQNQCLEKQVNSNWKHFVAQLVPAWGPIQMIIDLKSDGPSLGRYITDKSREKIGGITGFFVGEAANTLIPVYHTAVVLGSYYAVNKIIQYF